MSERIAEIERRSEGCLAHDNCLRSDMAYLLAELRKRDEALARVEGLAERWATLAEGDRYYARRLRAAIAAAAKP